VRSMMPAVAAGWPVLTVTVKYGPSATTVERLAKVEGGEEAVAAAVAAAAARGPPLSRPAWTWAGAELTSTIAPSPPSTTSAGAAATDPAATADAASALAGAADSASAAATVSAAETVDAAPPGDAKAEAAKGEGGADAAGTAAPPSSSPLLCSNPDRPSHASAGGYAQLEVKGVADKRTVTVARNRAGALLPSSAKVRLEGRERSAQLDCVRVLHSPDDFAEPQAQ
jgi:hypothetical protein